MTDDARFIEAMRTMGRSARLSLRQELRDAGFTEEPGCVIYVNGKPVVTPSASLTEYLPGEQDWLVRCRASSSPKK